MWCQSFPIRSWRLPHSARTLVGRFPFRQSETYLSPMASFTLVLEEIHDLVLFTPAMGHCPDSDDQTQNPSSFQFGSIIPPRPRETDLWLRSHAFVIPALTRKTTFGVYAYLGTFWPQSSSLSRIPLHIFFHGPQLWTSQNSPAYTTTPKSQGLSPRELLI